MVVKVVKPNLSELPDLIKLWGRQYKFHNDLDSEYYVPNSEKLRRKFRVYLEGAIKKNEPNILVAKEQDELVGFITFKITNADYLDTNIKRYGEVIELFVSDEHRRKGVGRMLLQTAERYFNEKEVEWVELQVSTFNTNAIDAYEHMGYQNRQTLMFKKLR